MPEDTCPEYIKEALRRVLPYSAREWVGLAARAVWNEMLEQGLAPEYWRGAPVWLLPRDEE